MGLAVFFTINGQPSKEPNYSGTLGRYVDSVFQDIGVRPPVKFYVNMVVGPLDSGGRVRFHLTIQDNYRAKGLLTEEEVDKVRRAFGFTEGPRWYMDSMNMKWLYK